MDPTQEYMNGVLGNQVQLESFEVEHALAAISRDTHLSPEIKTAIMSKLPIAVQSGNMSNQSVHQATGDGRYYGGNMATTTGQVAEMSIIAQRNSSNIATPLPVAIGMSDFLTNNYQQVLANFLALFSPGTVLSGVTVFPTIVRFTFANGANTDSVDLSCDVTSYSSFLSSLNSTWFKTVNMRWEFTNITTPANTDTDAGRQFKVSISPYFDTNFGMFGGNRSPLTNCKPPNQFLKNVIDIPWAKFPISPRQGWILPVINAANKADVTTLAMAHPVQELTRTVSGK